MSWTGFLFGFIVACVFMWVAMPERPHKPSDIQDELDEKD